MLAQFLPITAASRRTFWILFALIASAWVLLVAWHRSPYADLLGHEALAHHHIPFAAHMALFLLSWVLMIVAMMLPVSLPVIVDAQGERPRSARATAAVVAGYLIPWVFFGMLAFLGDSALHQITGHGQPGEQAAAYIAPSIILAAGIYQLTPFKHSFTERCRSLNNGERMDAHARTGGSFPGGLRLGLVCFGSCWLLMLLMFALGHHRPEWMLIFGAVAGAERLTPWGRPIAGVVGLALIVWAAARVAAVI